MAKRTRRPNLPSETLERARRELQRSGELPEQPAPHAEAQAAPQPVAPAVPASKARGPVDLRREYAYVVSDLKHMAMLAAAFMGVLVVLSFFF
jgi:hypothetical protein